jgi:crossover junction endodeoxyribonuclease RuvC
VGREPALVVNTQSMRILGVDPGTAIMGYGAVEGRGGLLRAIEYGALVTPASDALPQRLAALFQGLTRIVTEHRPTAMAVESLYFNKNARTALAVGHARGVALLVAAQAEIPVFEYTPQQVKDAVVGYGKASKEQVQAMIRTLLGLQEVPKPDDVADALAVAICHAHSARFSVLTV